jgi:galactosylgalactosylxylosylprotein 3-beta-glucuronosyltransferase 3
MPIIYIITPTNNRRVTQLADLTRMRNTLWLVPKVVWILVEDNDYKTDKIKNFLEYSKLDYVHLAERTPDEMLIKSSEKEWTKPRGVLQRNKAINWLRDNSDSINLNGVVYFADDDNTYDIRLFEEMRYTKKVSVWPVAFVGEVK